jgi:hypothetical protein
MNFRDLNKVTSKMTFASPKKIKVHVDDMIAKSKKGKSHVQVLK